MNQMISQQTDRRVGTATRLPTPVKPLARYVVFCATSKYMCIRVKYFTNGTDHNQTVVGIISREP